MDLISLGYDSRLLEEQRRMGIHGCEPARVTRVDKDRFLVRNGEREIQAELTGRFQFVMDSREAYPCVGDWVCVQYYNDGTLAMIHDVLPRKTFLRRKAAGNTIDYQMIASNIDLAFIIQSCDVNFNVRRMERYLVMVNEGGIEPIILLSKRDLISDELLDQIIEVIREARIDAKIIACSNKTETGIDALRQILQHGKTYCLLGSSGVGKTTLVNGLIGREEFETSPVREKDSRGRHTTASRHLTVLESGALLIDTPGMRELGMLAFEDGIEESFPDIAALSLECRFNDCNHTSDVGCAIAMAIERGDVSEDRFQRYEKLLRESEHHRMSYAEKRKKDRKFGRMVKSVLKQKKKDR